ncbi:MAG TPA: cytochrome c3 family protein, partial [Gammaproteobacteria bacterium]
TYTAYSSTTMDGTTNFTGSTSMACLSCHDGTQAMDNIVNAPGSGGYTDGGADLAYNWSGPTVDATGKLVAGALTNLGDGAGALGDDHPVAIPYGGGGVTVATPSGATTDPDFVQVGTGLTQAVVGGLQKWWFDADADTKMDSNEIRLYTANAQAQVECASCHDPHSEVNPTFLRIANTNSAVCTACHVK